jgi:hypothetical protein
MNGQDCQSIPPASCRYCEGQTAYSRLVSGWPLASVDAADIAYNLLKATAGTALP